MRAYSEDLRTRVVAAVDQGVPRDEVARLFQVSAPTIKRWLRLRRETGQLGARPIPGPPARKMDALRAELPAQIKTHPDATLDELCRWWEESHGSRVSKATMSRVLTRQLGLARRGVVGRRRVADSDDASAPKIDEEPAATLM
jgi:transposase